MSEQRTIYFDHASTTRPDPRVLAEMLPYLGEEYGNPSSHYYGLGQRAARAVDEARARVAALIGAQPDEIIFTSGGTEANNLAVKGLLAEAPRGKDHVVTSNIEHYSVLNALRALQGRGVSVTYLPVDGAGLLDPERVRAAITERTALVAVMHANSEIGVVQDIPAIAAVAAARGVPCFSDGVAAVGTVPVDVGALGVSALSLAAHQFYGPKGVGALYLRAGTKLGRLFDGGLQERGYRCGTENVPGIAGLGRAAAIAREEIAAWNTRLVPLRERLRAGLGERIEFMNFTGHAGRRLPGHVSFWIEYVEGESLLLWLAMSGVCAASGSACSSNIKGEDEEDLSSSHVLTAIGVPPEICHGSICFSLGRESTEEEVDFVLGIMPGIVQRLWAMSPLYAERRLR
ncbi:MAG TPA: aminotransferase class V-fold PLP-dependent enzyme [Candidatus Methanoperedens sp.]|nr:aminotransferase class V-fold PLP-dependent enzyme [Candidatus Methanoperedens sp.]